MRTSQYLLSTLKETPSDAEIVSRGKIAILMGSFASAVLGTVLIFLFSKKKTRI